MRDLLGNRRGLGYLRCRLFGHRWRVFCWGWHASPYLWYAQCKGCGAFHRSMLFGVPPPPKRSRYAYLPY